MSPGMSSCDLINKQTTTKQMRLARIAKSKKFLVYSTRCRVLEIAGWKTLDDATGPKGPMPKSWCGWYLGHFQIAFSYIQPYNVDYQNKLSFAIKTHNQNSYNQMKLQRTLVVWFHWISMKKHHKYILLKFVAFSWNVWLKGKTEGKICEKYM